MDINQVLRQVPKMSDLLEEGEILKLEEEYPREVLKAALNKSLEEVRRRLMETAPKAGCQEAFGGKLTSSVISLARSYLDSSFFNLKGVVNATGVVLHTNLGRAPLPDEVLEHICNTARQYSNLEYNIAQGHRGERYDHLREVLKSLTGAQDALVVNNNAAAVLLCLSALASGQEVIISRGELVEIGGSFRIPDVLAQSGAKLVEVGTTNKTHLKDYKRAISEDTGLILKVHPSNYKILGFTSQVQDRALKDLARDHQLPLMKDLGSGALVRLTPHGYPHEPTVMETLASGVDLITFSGDKLLGGPQAGIIVGKKELIEKIKVHPLTRALRIDKMTLAGLEAVLWFYKTNRWQDLPIYKMLNKSPGKMKRDAQNLAKGLKDLLRGTGEVEVVQDHSEVGGGTMPCHKMPTKAVALTWPGLTAQELSHEFRSCKTPIIGRIKKDRYILDVRTLQDGDMEKILEMAGDLL